MKSNRMVFFAACIGMLLFGVGLITLGSAASGLQRKFELDAVSSGTLFSILPIGILAGSLLFGPFCDRYGYKLFLILSSLGLFIGFQGIAYASSFTALQVYVFLFGFGGGAINGAANAVVSDISSDNKSADLSLLGVFFAIGALGMPLILGILTKNYPFETILSSVGFLPFAAAVFFLFTKFPAAKHKEGLPFLKGLKLLKDPFLVLTALFLFFQSSYEGIINNWTTTYLTAGHAVSDSKALYALSLYIAGMAVMRLLIGSVFRSAPPGKILYISFALLAAGSIILSSLSSYTLAVAGLIITGLGLAAGFPIMLGLAGSRYADLSGTAFSLMLVIALLGNMLLNYSMGVIAENYGIQYMPAVTFALLLAMLTLSFPILKKIKI